MTEVHKAQSETAAKSSESDRMKEALRRLAATAGDDVVEEIQSFIEELEETISAKQNRIDEAHDEMEDMVYLRDVRAQEQIEEDVWRNLARVHRYLKAGKTSDALEELEITLNRNHSDWRMYVS